MRKENTLGIAHGKDDNNGCHQTDVSHCDKCGIELTRNDIREYGGLCWSCWKRCFGHNSFADVKTFFAKLIRFSKKNCNFA